MHEKYFVFPISVRLDEQGDLSTSSEEEKSKVELYFDPHLTTFGSM